MTNKWTECPMGRIRGGGMLRAGAALLALLWTASPGNAAAEPGGAAIDEIVDVLHGQGLIDDGQRDRILMKHYSEQTQAQAASAAPAVSQGLLEGFEWEGDLRLRYEGFFYDTDEFNSAMGTTLKDRNRFRYRFRLGFKKAVNDWATVGVRLVSGSDGGPAAGDGNHRSANRTLGDDEDFDKDSIFIDRVWADIALPQAGEISSKLRAGKIANPFLWKKGKGDLILWDSDINPEGAAILAKMKTGESSEIFFTGGGFIVDENSSSNDPKFFGAQLGGSLGLGDGISAGARVTGYEWRTLDAAFLGRTAAAGTGTGSLGNLASAYDSRARIGELSAYLDIASSEDWPVMLYGTAAQNFTADSAVLGGVTTDEEDLAWGAGFEVGRSSKLFKLGAGYFNVEANSVVALFTDSDLFDGHTNRRGWMLYGSKKVAKGTELKVEFFDSDVIKNSGGAGGPFAGSIDEGDRKRVRGDVVFKF